MHEVTLFVYDLSKGLASQFSENLLGTRINGIWHTAIRVFNKEIYFGSAGIQKIYPESTIMGSPQDKVFLGNTNKSEKELDSYLKILTKEIFHGSSYDLLYHNCNTFSNELAHFLLNVSIPEYITNLPIEVIKSPFGKMMMPFIEQMNPFNENVTNNNLKEFEITFFEFKEDVNCDLNSLDLSPLNDSIRSVISSLFSHTISNSEINFTNDFIDLMKTISNEDKSLSSVFFECLRIVVLKNFNIVEILNKNLNEWIDLIYLNTDSIKLKFVSNFLSRCSKHVDDAFRKIITNCMNNLRDGIYIHENLCILRNIISLYNQEIEEDLLIDIGSYLIHMVINCELSEYYSKEHAIYSLCVLVKSSEIVKDLAVSFDLNKRNRRETQYCKILQKELLYK